MPQNQQAQYLPVPPTGAASYALGFLAFIGIPFLSILVAGIVMAAVYPSAKEKAGSPRRTRVVPPTGESQRP